jgi:hypothetical protein
MQSVSYIVHLIGCDTEPPYKHFGALADAVEYGNSEAQSGNAERANIYEVAGTGLADAIAQWKAGNATLIRTCSRHPSDTETKIAHRQALDTARKAGPRVLLKHLGLTPRDAPDPPQIKRRGLLDRSPRRPE